MARFICLSALAVAFISAERPTDAEANGELREKIFNSWRIRQDLVKSASFKIRCTLLITEDEQRRIQHRHRSLNGGYGGTEVAPSKDVFLTEFYEVAMKGDKLRFSRSVSNSSKDDAKLTSRHGSNVYATNGVDYRSLQVESGDSQPQGAIVRSDNFVAFRSWEMSPIYFTFRSCSQQYGLMNVGNYEVVSRAEELNGVPAIVLKMTNELNSSVAKQYWIDASREYVVMRVQATDGNGSVRSQQDIEYQEDESGVFVPVKWINTLLTPEGEIRRSDEFVVLSHEINKELTESVFTLEFPPGTLVQDTREGLGPKQRVWTVTADGSKNMRKGFDPDGKNTEPPTRRRIRPSIALWVNGLLLVVAMVFVARRKYKTLNSLLKKR